ncbi:MAG: hypothetical protein JNK48_31790 [Bryobacterales bacterium]|nr:hypothetical protein [Bryobacterales bacterium]
MIQRFDKENLYGYLNLGAYLLPNGVEMLNPSGALLVIPYEEIKSVSLVREFEAPDPNEKRVFTTRPKSQGLWVRMYFRDNDQLEGLMANNLLAVEPYGFSFTPPDASSNIQRVFVPRQAVTGFQVLAVVGSPQRAKAKAKPTPKEQMGLFE